MENNICCSRSSSFEKGRGMRRHDDDDDDEGAPSWQDGAPVARLLPPPDLDTMIAAAKGQPPTPATSDRISAVQNAVLTAISELGLLQNGTTPVAPHSEPRYLELTKDKPIKLQVRILVPVKEHPKFNFVGKLLGPKGNSLKRLQEETMTKMAILGRGSMRDKAKEAELRQMNDRKFAHLNEELHVEISTFASPAEAYARISHALLEIKRFLVPDYNDDIRQDQFRELAYINGDPLPAPPPPPRRPGSHLAPPAARNRVGLLATPSGRAVAARPSVVVPPPARTMLRSSSSNRAVTYRAAVTGDARLRVDDDYVYSDGYAYVDTFDDRDPYYDYPDGGAAAVDPYSQDYGDDWHRGSESSPRLKSSRPKARASFRDHPYGAAAPRTSPPSSRF